VHCLIAIRFRRLIIELCWNEISIFILASL
jgi:hypothetical protein